MKKKLIVTGIVGTLMLASAAAGAYGASNLEAIKAHLNLGIKFKVNGENWTPKDSNGKTIYAITYNNTTYLPVRATADALSVDIKWDAGNNTVQLGKGSSNSGNASSTSSSSVGLSRSNPAAIGTTVKYSVDDILDKYTAEIKIDQVIRGEDAWDLIESANLFNDPAPNGYEYVLAKINFKVISNKKTDAAIGISAVNFTLVSSTGKDYDYASVVDPDPAFDGNLYEGASASGWATFLVKTDDKAPLLTFGRNYDGTKGAWFKLQ